MKKNNIKHLSLNKIKIASLGLNKIRGGGLNWYDNKLTQECPTQPTECATCFESCGATC